MKNDLGAELYQASDHTEVIDEGRGIWLMWDKQIDWRGTWEMTLGLVTTHGNDNLKATRCTNHAPWHFEDLKLSIN